MFEEKVCKVCEALREQLQFERERNRELTETLTSLLKPKPIIIEEREPDKNPATTARTWSQRRRILEANEAQKISLVQNSPLAAKPDEIKSSEAKTSEENQKDIEALEESLGIAEEGDNDGSRTGIGYDHGTNRSR